MRGAVVVGLVAVLGLGCGSSSTGGGEPVLNEEGDAPGEACLLADDDVPEFEATWAEAEAAARAETCGGALWSVGLGQCDTGHLVVARWFGFSGVNAYYDPDTGEFLAVQRTSDTRGPNCSGRGSWPVEVECNEATWTSICVRDFDDQ